LINYEILSFVEKTDVFVIYFPIIVIFSYLSFILCPL